MIPLMIRSTYICIQVKLELCLTSLFLLQQREVVHNRTRHSGFQNPVCIARAKGYCGKILEASDSNPIEGAYERERLSHCLDTLREAIMCVSNVGILTGKVNAKAQRSIGRGDVVHSCRSFDDRSTSKSVNAIFSKSNLVIPEF